VGGPLCVVEGYAEGKTRVTTDTIRGGKINEPHRNRIGFKQKQREWSFLYSLRQETDV
jgi:hypothetical protein